MTFQEYIQEELNYYNEYYSEMNDISADVDLECIIEVDYTTQD